MPEVPSTKCSSIDFSRSISISSEKPLSSVDSESHQHLHDRLRDNVRSLHFGTACLGFAAVLFGVLSVVLGVLLITGTACDQCHAFAYDSTQQITSSPSYGSQDKDESTTLLINAVEAQLVPAICDLEYISVSMDNYSEDDTTMDYMSSSGNLMLDHHPIIVRVWRCGGFCADPYMACKPTDLTTRGMYVNTPNMENVWMEVEEHLQCQCQCEIIPEKCSKQHYYDNCKCICKDEHAKRTCLQDQWQTHYWVESTCQCVCREEGEECSTGSVFDHDTCQCIKK